MSLSIPNTFSPNTAISSSEVNANFQAVATLLNSTLLDSTYIQTGGLATANYADSSVTLAKLAAAVQALLVPTGAISGWSTETAPTGWLKCDGTAVNRTTYAALFAVIGETFGQGDNSTTFNLPDFRGRFLRGMDDGQGRDPDAAGRTAMATGGLDGDNIGSIQGDATAQANSAFTAASDGAHTHSATVSGSPAFAGTGGNVVSPAGATSVVTASNALSIASGGAHTHSVSGGDNETRPLNANVYWIIKS